MTARRQTPTTPRKSILPPPAPPQSAFYEMPRRIAIDLYAGLGGWTDGLLAEGWDVIGFDVERHDYGSGGYPAQLVLQDVLTLHGSQFRNASLIVASPPCQNYSYMAMPWKRGKAIAAEIRDDQSGRKLDALNALFNACFRIQAEASAAAGRHIPMVVENVRGAQPWVGRAKANFGSFYLWGDIAMVGNRIVRPEAQFGEAHTRAYRVALKSTGPQNENGELHRQSINKMRDCLKVPGMNFHDHEKTGQPGRSFQSAAVAQAGVKASSGGPGYGGDFGWDGSPMRRGNSHSSARKAASAQIAKIPFELSVWVARAYWPSNVLSDLGGGWKREDGKRPESQNLPMRATQRWMAWGRRWRIMSNVLGSRM